MKAIHPAYNSCHTIHEHKRDTNHPPQAHIHKTYDQILMLKKWQLAPLGQLSTLP